MPKRVVVKDKGMKRAQRAIRAMDGFAATVGIHTDDNAHDGEMTNARLGAIHEFGVTFTHPGGTPYMVVGGRAVFLPKGDSRATGVTGPHEITIPERSFLRSAWDKNVRGYERALAKFSGRVIDGTLAPSAAVGLLAEKVLDDIIMGINRGIPPELAPATSERKDSTKQLIHTGQLKMSIKAKVSK